MIVIPIELQEKHKLGIQAAMNYYVYNLPTGLDDETYNRLEEEARQDGVELRDYATQFIQGRRSLNADYIGKVEKSQVTGDMKEAMISYMTEHPEIKYWPPKYDGSSLAAYYNPSTGKLQKVVTIGGSNLGSEGIDQTEKLGHFFPSLPGTGIMALQCECLVALEKGLGEKSRQKANGLINASYTPLTREEFKGGRGNDKEYQKYLEKFEENFKKVKSEVDDLLTLRCFRYFIDPSYSCPDYKAGLESLPIVYNSSGDIKFCGGYVLGKEDIQDFVNSDIWTTPTGTFLVDGVVGYSGDGVCIRALKYKDAGRGEATEVLGIKWNDMSKKGKDSWSANAIINPVIIRGTDIKKPTVGSIKNMIDTGLSKGAKVTIIIANSTIPQVSKVLSPGNGDFEWPTCECGWTLGPSDCWGTLAKCGNPKCTKRESRMRDYLKGCQDFKDIDLNKLLVIDRFDWSKKTDLSIVLPDLLQIIYEGHGIQAFKDYLSQYLKTDLQKKNLELVSYPAFITLTEYVNGKFRKDTSGWV